MVAAMSPAVRRVLRTLGEDISTARRKRRLTQTDLAARMSVSVGTVKRLEAGDPGVSIGSLAMALLAFGDIAKLVNLMAEGSDDIGLMLGHADLPQRVRRRKAGSRRNSTETPLFAHSESGALF